MQIHRQRKGILRMPQELQKTIMALAFCISVVVGFYMWSLDAYHSRLGFVEQEGLGVPVSQIGLALTFLLLGVLFGALFQELHTQGTPVRIGGILRGVLARSDLWQGLLAAPLLFSGVYAASRTHPDLIISSLFAFQTGFSCKQVTTKIEANHEAVDVDASGNSACSGANSVGVASDSSAEN